MTALPRPLLAALAVTLAATGYLTLQADDEAIVAPSAPTRQRSAGATGGADPTRPEAQSPDAQRPDAPPRGWPAALPERDSASWRPVAPAAALAWGVPPPAAAPAAPPPVTATPEPPALDYALIGRIDEAGQQRALLTGPRRTLSLKVGDVVDGQWRVESLQDDGVDLVWQPTGQHRLLGYKTN